jgi:hypothetical protein
MTLAGGSRLVDVRIPVPDRTDILAEVTTLAAELQIEVFDLEISRSLATDRGTLVLTVSAPSGSTFLEALSDRGYEASLHPRPD